MTLAGPSVGTQMGGKARFVFAATVAGWAAVVCGFVWVAFVTGACVGSEAGFASADLVADWALESGAGYCFWGLAGAMSGCRWWSCGCFELLVLSAAHRALVGV